MQMGGTLTMAVITFKRSAANTETQTIEKNQFQSKRGTFFPARQRINFDPGSLRSPEGLKHRIGRPPVISCF